MLQFSLSDIIMDSPRGQTRLLLSSVPASSPCILPTQVCHDLCHFDDRCVTVGRCEYRSLQTRCNLTTHFLFCQFLVFLPLKTFLFPPWKGVSKKEVKLFGISSPLSLCHGPARGNNSHVCDKYLWSICVCTILPGVKRNRKKRDIERNMV